MPVDADQFQLWRPGSIGEVGQTSSEDKLVITVMLEPKHHPFILMRRTKPPFRFLQIRQWLVRRETLGPPIRIRQVTGALFQQIRGIRNRSLIEWIGVFQEIAGKSRLS